MTKFSIRTLLLLTCLVATLTTGFLLLHSRFDDSEFVQRCRDLEGKSVADVLADPDILAREHWNFDEPPGVLRGISVTTTDGRIVMLSIARFPELFSEQFEWDEQFFAGCEIVSVSAHGRKRTFLESMGIAR